MSSLGIVLVFWCDRVDRMPGGRARQLVVGVLAAFLGRINLGVLRIDRQADVGMTGSLAAADVEVAAPNSHARHARLLGFWRAKAARGSLWHVHERPG